MAIRGVDANIPVGKAPELSVEAARMARQHEALQERIRMQAEIERKRKKLRAISSVERRTVSDREADTPPCTAAGQKKRRDESETTFDEELRLAAEKYKTRGGKLDVSI